MAVVQGIYELSCSSFSFFLIYIPSKVPAGTAKVQVLKWVLKCIIVTDQLCGQNTAMNGMYRYYTVRMLKPWQYTSNDPTL